MTKETPITDEWLLACDFKWRQAERQPNKHYTLNCNGRTTDSLIAYQTGIELQRCGWENRNGDYIGDPECWMLWVTDSFDRTAFLGHIKFQQQVVQLAEMVCGYPWTPTNHIYGQTWPDDKQRKASDAIVARMDKL